MSLNFFSKESLISELDLKGFNYSQFKEKEETVPHFKERLLSCFTFPSSDSEIGISSTLARALGAYPVYIGLLSMNTAFEVSNHNAILECRQQGTDELIFQLSAFENKTLGDLAYSLDYEEAGTLHLVANKYYDKNLSFILPFFNKTKGKKIQAHTGICYLNNEQIIANSIIAFNDHMKYLTEGPGQIQKKGDWYFDGSDQILYTYEGATIESFSFYCDSYLKVVPLFYCPVSVLEINKIIENNILLENKTLTIDNSYTVEDIPTSCKEILWNTFKNNPGTWNINDGPVSIRGRYANLKR